MRIFTTTILIAGLALMTAACSKPATAPSGAAASPATGMSGDYIDNWAAVVEKRGAAR